MQRDGSANNLRRDGSANALVPTPGVGFEIFAPRLPKQARQQRDRCQHWGPEPIASEHLTAMRESWKQCINERLFRCMFSDRMEEQLLALQTWKYQVTEHTESVIEVLDMLLKWLTWMLFNTNTQIWKLTLEVFSALLDGLAAVDVQLTDREAHILAANVLERSGHNIQSVRDTMMAILRQIVWVYPRLKLLPLILLALPSKNKRSVACAMRLLGESLDRTVAATLARQQKDLGIIVKMVDDKDAEVRRNAIHALASLSQHLDPSNFDRIVNSMPKSTQPIIKSAASKLPPGPWAEDSKLANAEEAHAPLPTSRTGTAGTESPGPRMRRSGSGQGTSGSMLASPSKMPAHSPVKSQVNSRPVTPLQGRPDAASRPATPIQGRPEVASRPATPIQGRLEAPRAATPIQGRLEPARAQVAAPAVQQVVVEKVSIEAPTSTSSVAPTEPVQVLAQRLSQCGGEDFRILCATLKQRVRQSVEGDAVALAEALVHAMRAYFGHDGCADRCTPLVELLDEFCASKECLRPLPTSLLRGMLKEQLRNLQYSSWTKRVENGASILRTLNLSCVMLLNGINRSIAYSLLLELGTDESEAVHSSLVVKCLRKLNKSLGSSRNPEQEVQAALDVVRQWLQKVHPRLLLSQGQEKGMVESAAASLMDGVKEMVDAARTACPAAATAWAIRHQTDEEEGQMVRDWVLNGTGLGGEKENQPAAAPASGAPQKLDANVSGILASPRKEGRGTPLKSRVSSPAKLSGSPHAAQGGLA